MNTLTHLIAALVVLPAIGSVVWALRTLRRAETDLRVEADLDHGDFDIGTWPRSARVT
jgi:hypothetical protein